MNPGVDLYVAQPIGEGTIGTTWPRIHPHGHFLLMERLNPAAKEGL
jgi:hypothetical protein